MAKTRYLTLIAISLLLIGCEEKSMINKPVFSSYKEEAVFADFYSSYLTFKAGNKILSADNETSVPSFVSETKFAYESTSSEKVSGYGKEMVVSEISTRENMEVKNYYNSQQNIFEYIGRKNYLTNHKYYNGESTFETVDEELKSFALQNDKKGLGIYNLTSFALSYPEEERNIGYIASQISFKSAFISKNYFHNEMTWESIPEDLRTRYTFYVDDSVLTISYRFVVEAEGKETINEEEVVTSRRNQVVNCTIQLLFNEFEFCYREYRTSSNRIEKYDVGETYISKTVSTSKSETSLESIIRLKDDVDLEKKNASTYSEALEVIDDLYYDYY